MVHCHKCGAKAADDDMFCPDCGAKILKEEQKKEKPPAPKPTEPEVPKPKRKEPREVPKPKAEPQPQKAIVQQKKSSSTKIILAIIIFILVITLFRSCRGPGPRLPYEPWPKPQPYYEPTPSPPPPAPEPYYEPEPTPPQIDKAKECSGVSAEVTGACWSCGLVDCGFVTKVKNTGSKPILRFKTKCYETPTDVTEGEVWDPLDAGAEGTYYPSEGDDVRLVEFIPVILVGDEEVVCDNRVASYGNAYGDGFGEC